ncbi:MAG TPA: hypothetical protein VFM18_24155 [Methanosarcina sp.]|nr:hypothetical protein [Methanosarcina sp.]
MSQPNKIVYMVLSKESGDRASNWSTGTSIYQRKCDAEKLAKRKSWSKDMFYVQAFQLIPIEETP